MAKINILRTGSVLLLLLSLNAPVSAQHDGLSPEGSWQLDLTASSDIDPWREVKMDLVMSDAELTVTRLWRAGKYYQRDSLSVPIDGVSIDVPIRAGKWFDQVYEGVFIPENAVRRVTARMKEGGRLLHVTSDVPLETSQGQTRVVTDRYLRLSADGLRLLVTETRSSRHDGPPIVYLFNRVDTP